MDQAKVYKGGSDDKIIFYIHGGGWHFGTNDSSQHIADSFKDYTVVAPQYRLSAVDTSAVQMTAMAQIIVFTCLTFYSVNGLQMILSLLILTSVALFLSVVHYFIPQDGARHPEHIEDITKAFAEMMKQYNPKTVHVMGHSAGGHLASLLCTNRHYLESVGCSLEDVTSCICISGVYSDVRLKDHMVGKQILKSAFGHKEHYGDAFPIYHIKSDVPPVLLLNAEYDYQFKPQSYDFHYALRQKGVWSEIDYFEDYNHVSLGRKWDDNPKVVKRIDAFMNKILSH